MEKENRFESDANTIIARIQTELGMQIQNLEPLSVEKLGDNSEVYRAQYDGTNLIIKLLPGDRDFRMEQAAFSLFNERGIPSPRVLGVLGPQDLHKAVIVETEIAGEPISHMEEKIPLYETVGKILSKIHSIKIPGYGSFEITPQGLRGTMSTWKENAEAFKLDFASLEYRGFINANERAKLERAHEITGNTNPSPASFMHSDYSPQHVFSDGKIVTGVIDVANCYAGDPHKDITNMQYFLNSAQLEAFNNGYGPEACDDLIPYFAVLTAANKVAYRADRGFTDRLPEGLRMLQKRLKELE